MAVMVLTKDSVLAQARRDFEARQNIDLFVRAFIRAIDACQLRRHRDDCSVGYAIEGSAQWELQLRPSYRKTAVIYNSGKNWKVRWVDGEADPFVDDEKIETIFKSLETLRLFVITEVPRVKVQMQRFAIPDPNQTE